MLENFEIHARLGATAQQHVIAKNDGIERISKLVGEPENECNKCVARAASMRQRTRDGVEDGVGKCRSLESGGADERAQQAVSSLFPTCDTHHTVTLPRQRNQANRGTLSPRSEAPRRIGEQQLLDVKRRGKKSVLKIWL